MGNLKPERASSILRARLRKVRDDGAGGALRSWTRLLPLLLLSALALWLFLSGVGSHPAAAAVTNRGFETGDLTGWSTDTVTESVTVAAGTRTVEWGPGWHNAVWTGAASTPEEAFACAEGKYAAAYRYTTGGWQGYFPSLPDSSTMTELDQYDAFLILITESVSCPMPVEAAPGATRMLEWAVGWQNVGWTGADGTSPEEAFACAEGKYAAAYRYTTAGWQGYFPALPDSAYMADLDQYDAFFILVTAPVSCDMSIGGAPASGPTPTPTAAPSATPTPTPSPTPSPTPFVYPPPPEWAELCIYRPAIPSIWPWGDRWAEVQAFADELEPEYELAIRTASLDASASGSCSPSGVGDFWDVDCHGVGGPDLRCEIWYWSDDWADIDCDEYWFEDDLKETQIKAVARILEDDPEVLMCTTTVIGSFYDIGCTTIYGGHFTCDGWYIGYCTAFACRAGY